MAEPIDEKPVIGSHTTTEFGIKINAIKHVRTVTGCGLKEAKDFVDAL